MTSLAWFCATFGLIVVSLAMFAIFWDICAVYEGEQTISAWTIAFSRKYPIFPALVGLFTGLAIGALAGHLWFPQYQNP